MHLYVDGSEVGTGTPFSGKIKYESPIGEGAIGAYRGSCKLTLSGIVDEVRIWTGRAAGREDLAADQLPAKREPRRAGR